jgi:hypothetical protein
MKSIPPPILNLKTSKRSRSFKWDETSLKYYQEIDVGQSADDVILCLHLHLAAKATYGGDKNREENHG